MRLILLMAAALTLAPAQDTRESDRYPEVRALIREAEAAAVNIRIFSDHSNPSSRAARLYARAGYLNDAARAFEKSGDPPNHSYYLLRAHVLYGDLAGAEAKLESMVDLESRAKILEGLADLLWRMGEPAKARIRFEAARQVAQKIANLERRKRVLTSIQQSLTYVSSEPPFRISPRPEPWKRIDVEDSPIAPFPVTTGGFRDLDSTEIADRTRSNGEFIKKLYGRVEASDRQGLLRVSESAATPFQKALGMASMEHILILAGQRELAEEYAKKIPESDSDCRLAKAEALGAAGAAWLRAGDSNRAHPNFEAAISLVKSVPDMPLGKVSVVISIAAAQFKGGMVATSATSFKLAIELAQDLPIRPEPAKAPAKRPSSLIHYQDEAYNKILLAAIRAHNLGLAREIAERWRVAGGKADGAVVDAWMDADQIEEALVAARKIANAAERADALFGLAFSLLNSAGAPNF